LTKRVLITGISGFTGRYMQSSLEKAGYEVSGSSLAPSHEPSVMRANLCDLESMCNLVETVVPNIVIHMGGISNVAHGVAADLYSTNIVGSRNLLQALSMCKTPVQSVMMVSSANLYGNSNSDLITEESQIIPTNDYSISKLAMENLCSLWADELPILIVRPFNYTGVGQSDNFLIPKIVKYYIRRAKTITLGNLDVFREFNDVRNIVDIYKRLLEVKPIGKTINICSGNIYSLSDIIRIMNNLAGYKINIEIDPHFVRKNEIKSLRGSNTLLKNTIGPLEFNPLEETLRWMYEKSSI
jgi:nucleoside-diphosphate-sugar epimerase